MGFGKRFIVQVDKYGSRIEQYTSGQADGRVGRLIPWRVWHQVA